MSTTRTRFITLAIAGVVGVAAGLWGWPRWRTHHALSTITADAAPRRASAWAWLEGTDRSGGPRMTPWRDRIEARLADATPAALLDGTLALRRVGGWGWDETDRALVARDLLLRADSVDPADHGLALEMLATAPFDLDPALVIGVVADLHDRAEEQVSTQAFDLALAWAGPDRVEQLVSLTTIRPGRMHLALSWAPRAVAGIGVAADAAWGDRVTHLVRVTATRPGDATAALAAVDDPAFEDVLPYVLHLSRDPRATTTLERLAAAGHAAARFALLAQDPAEDAARSARMATDRGAALTARRIAAWRWPDTPVTLVHELLARDLADEDGHVAAAALLAERRLPPAAARAKAEAWMRSFNDDEKRAGALLATLLGVHADLLDQAYRLEDQPSVRTTQRLALWALGRPPGPGDPVEFAHRVLHEPGGAFDPDVAACMLRAGRPEALAHLTSPPPPRRAPVQARAWLLERFVPEWHTAAGRPIGGSVDAVQLHFARLDALRVLTSRRWTFDAGMGVFRGTDAAADADADADADTDTDADADADTG
ncbi:MAG: hypothetical protein HKO59_01315, partial [Phycisphaerales bacterium]|nr:hypothetical protein [Phycisphaerae bacterium]NNM24619.1 hypothetical protein [Phycisphaerales bacterium]